MWLYATLRGVGSARELARLCESHIAYRWLCGGVGVNHRLLSDFRTRHVAWLDAALTASVAALLHAGAVMLERVAGRPVYMAMAMTADRKLRLKPQNLLVNLPIAGKG